MLLSTCFTLSFTPRDWMAVKAVQSKNTIAIMHPPLWVEISPVELAHDEIVHIGTLPQQNYTFECVFIIILKRTKWSAVEWPENYKKHTLLSFLMLNTSVIVGLYIDFYIFLYIFPCCPISVLLWISPLHSETWRPENSNQSHNIHSVFYSVAQ